MSHPAHFTPDTLVAGRSSLFATGHVQIDTAKWSPSFEAQVRSWASTATLMLVLENGEALLSFPGDTAASFGPLRPLPQQGAANTSTAARPRPMEVCTVFRFSDPGVATADLDTLARPGAMPWLSRPPVQLAPGALLRYYWRTHALILGYPAPGEHVEEDSLALLRHAISLACAMARASAECLSPGRLRQRALAQNAVALMAQSVAEPHPIAHVARALNTSPFHLAHVFRTEVGSSPHKYLVRLRVLAALVRLRGGARDLSMLALELGFCHHSHFTAVFRHTLGYTPREVRRMLTAECIADLGIARRQCS